MPCVAALVATEDRHPWRMDASDVDALFGLVVSVLFFCQRALPLVWVVVVEGKKGYSPQEKAIELSGKVRPLMPSAVIFWVICSTGAACWSALTGFIGVCRTAAEQPACEERAAGSRSRVRHREGHWSRSAMCSSPRRGCGPAVCCGGSGERRCPGAAVSGEQSDVARKRSTGIASATGPSFSTRRAALSVEMSLIGPRRVLGA